MAQFVKQGLPSSLVTFHCGGVRGSAAGCFPFKLLQKLCLSLTRQYGNTQILLSDKLCKTIPGSSEVFKPNPTKMDDQMSEKNILLELDKLSKNKFTENDNRHDLQSKLETLVAFGCTFDQIQELPEILQLGLTEIVKRACLLKEFGENKISVQLLKVIRSTMSVPQIRQKLKEVQPLRNHLTLTDYMQDILQCTSSEMHTIVQRVPTIRAFRNMNAFSIKVEYLRSQGLTTEDFIRHPSILCRSMQALSKRIEAIKLYQVSDEFPVASLIVSNKQFARFLFKYNADQQIMNGSKDRSECIAKMLGVPAMLESQMQYFYRRRLTTVKPRIDYLVSINIPLEHITNHPYILRYRIETLQKAFAKSQEAGIENLSILHLAHIIMCGRVPLKPPMPNSSSYLPELLGLSANELKNKSHHIRPLVTTNRLSLKENFDFLLNEGFTADQIITCPLVLSHKLEELKTSLEMLPHRPEMQDNLDLLEDGSMKLNLIQYFLEREYNFRTSTFLY